jgi:hypothetical protein
MLKFSFSTLGFYNDSYSDIPTDAVEVTDDERSALLAGQASGKAIVRGDDGRPTLGDPVLTDNQLAAAARLQRDGLLANADNQVNTLEDNGSDTTAWRAYRQALRNVPQEAGFPRTITWPTQPQ